MIAREALANAAKDSTVPQQATPQPVRTISILKAYVLGKVEPTLEELRALKRTHPGKYKQIIRRQKREGHTYIDERET